MAQLNKHNLERVKQIKADLYHICPGCGSTMMPLNPSSAGYHCHSCGHTHWKTLNIPIRLIALQNFVKGVTG